MGDEVGQASGGEKKYVDPVRSMLVNPKDKQHL
jgi:hypothetical protein